jgi:phosphotransferase system HPr (HPr) family protein
MQKRELKIINRLGLHARAAAQIVHQVSRFQCSVALAIRKPTRAIFWR